MSISFAADSIQVSLPVAAALLAFASKDDMRPHLGVGVDAGHLCATDGHRAVQFPVSPAPEGWQGKVWSRVHVETLVKIAKARKETLISLESAACLPAHTFPPVDRVLPSYGMEASGSIGFNPAYFADIAKVVKACEAQGALLASARGGMDPVGFTIRGPSLTARAVVMPMRI